MKQTVTTKIWIPLQELIELLKNNNIQFPDEKVRFRAGTGTALESLSLSNGGVEISWIEEKTNLTNE